jgi:hypothetical protein
MLTDCRINQIISDLRTFEPDSRVFQQKFKELKGFYDKALKARIKLRLRGFALTLDEEELDAESNIILDNVWKQLEKDIFIPPEKGGYSFDKHYQFYGWLMRRYDHMFILVDKELLESIEELRSGHNEKWQDIFEILRPRLKEVLIKRFTDADDKEIEAWLDGMLSIKAEEILKIDKEKGGYDFYQETGLRNTTVIEFLNARFFGKDKSYDKEKPVSFGEEENDCREPDAKIDLANIYIAHTSYRMLFKLICLCGGYPHEQLSFLFSKFIGGQSVSQNAGTGKRKERTFEGQPKDFALKFGRAKLSELFLSLSKTIIDVLEDDDLTPLLEPIEKRLSYTNSFLLKGGIGTESEESKAEAEMTKIVQKCRLFELKEACNTALLDYSEYSMLRRSGNTLSENGNQENKTDINDEVLSLEHLEKSITKQWCTNVVKSIFLVLESKKAAVSVIDQLKDGHERSGELFRLNASEIIGVSFDKYMSFVLERIKAEIKSSSKYIPGLSNELDNKKIARIIDEILELKDDGIPKVSVLDDDSAFLKSSIEKLIRNIIDIVSDKVREELCGSLSSDVEVKAGFSSFCALNRCKLSHIRPCT